VHHPLDAEEGFCCACMAFTRPPARPAALFWCAACGSVRPVPPSHDGPVTCGCGSPEPMIPSWAAQDGEHLLALAAYQAPPRPRRWWHRARRNGKT